jgi:hypothetical protein
MKKTTTTTTTRKAKSSKSRKSKSQQGGSPASSLVMEALTDPPVMNDYFPRVGGSSCQSGGSTASDMVLSNLNSASETVKFPEGFNPKGNIESLNTYEINGGSRKRRASKGRKGRKGRKGSMSKKHGKSHRKSKSRKSKKNIRHHMMRGGSDWISSQYSLGNINAGGMNNHNAEFSASQGVDRNALMNPPTLGLAGSGYPMGSLEGANVNSVGAPLV